MTATLTSAVSNGTVVLTITDDETGAVETHTVKDGGNVIGRIDRKLSDLMWDRSGFVAGTALLTRPALYVLLTKANG